MLNKKAPSINPRGTPEIVSKYVLVILLILTDCFLPLRYEYM